MRGRNARRERIEGEEKTPLAELAGTGHRGKGILATEVPGTGHRGQKRK